MLIILASVNCKNSMGTFSSKYFHSSSQRSKSVEPLQNRISVVKKLSSSSVQTVKVASDDNNAPKSDDFPIYAKNYEKQCIERFHSKRRVTMRRRCHLTEFLTKRVIGTGSFGNVFLVKHNQTGMHCALKVMNKADLVRANQHHNATRERNLLEWVSFPLIVELVSSFKDNLNVYLVLKFIPGGELFSYVHRLGKLPEKQVKFYGAQMVLFLEYLHNLDIIYRDIKPENILISANGYIKVTDFGFAKHLNGREATYTLCGTPEYLAPELIVKGKSHGKPADWWALGVLLFELVNGTGPFAAESRQRTYQNILDANYQFTSNFSLELQAAVAQLFTIDVKSRLCSFKGASEIKQQAFFKDVNWRAMYEQKIPAPWIPKITSTDDTHYYGDYGDKDIKIETVANTYEDEFIDF